MAVETVINNAGGNDNKGNNKYDSNCPSLSLILQSTRIQTARKKIATTRIFTTPKTKKKKERQR